MNAGIALRALAIRPVAAARPAIRVRVVTVENLVVADVAAHCLGEPERERKLATHCVIKVIALKLEVVAHPIQSDAVIILQVRLAAQGHAPAWLRVEVAAA